VFGKAFHETVQEWLTTLYEVSGVAADAMDLEDNLYEGLIFHYSDEKKNNDGEHFLTAKDLQEFYEDGCTILKYLKKNRAAYFGRQGWHLVGVEIPLMIEPKESHPGVLFKGFIDLVLYHEPSDEFHIFDIKTSTRGWGDKEKKDEMKQSQLILYKNFFNKQFGIDPEKIHIKFFIVKRKIWEQAEFAQKRIQQWIPPSGPIKTKKALAVVDDFIKAQTLKEAKKEEPELDDDAFFVDPKSAVKKAIENHPSIKEAQQASMAMRQQEVLGKIGSKHPNYQDTIQDPAFADWVKSSRIRMEMYARAETQFDYDAADELLSTWEERQSVAKTVAETTKVDRQQQLKAASVNTQGATDSVAKKKYRRADIIKLMQTDPDRYDAMSSEIMKAYQEGRVI
jgi:hypothetical protein